MTEIDDVLFARQPFPGGVQAAVLGDPEDDEDDEDEEKRRSDEEDDGDVDDDDDDDEEETWQVMQAGTLPGFRSVILVTPAAGFGSSRSNGVV